MLRLIFKCKRKKTLIVKQYFVVSYTFVLPYHARRTQSDLRNRDRQKKKEKQSVQWSYYMSYKNLFSEDENRFDSAYAYFDLSLHSRLHLGKSELFDIFIPVNISMKYCLLICISVDIGDF